MADYEHIILSHYNLATPYPTEWPAAKDESDASDEDLPSPLKAQLNVPLRRSKSKFSALERRGIGRRSLVPGSQKTQDGLENLVQKDEPDPLGKYDSVVSVLRSRGLPVDSDTHTRAYLYLRLVYPVLIIDRQSLPALVHDLLTDVVPVTGPVQCIHAITAPRTRVSLSID